MFSRVCVPCLDSWKLFNTLVKRPRMNSNSSNGYIIINILSPVLKLFVQEERQMKEATSVMNPKSDDEQIGK